MPRVNVWMLADSIMAQRPNLQLQSFQSSLQILGLIPRSFGVQVAQFRTLHHNAALDIIGIFEDVELRTICDALVVSYDPERHSIHASRAIDPEAFQYSHEVSD